MKFPTLSFEFDNAIFTGYNYEDKKGGITVNIIADLFLTFARVGMFTFGGGYAMISMIEDICVERKKWITHDEMMQMTVIAESTPGPIAINCATFVGYKHAGIPGSIVATAAMVLPSFVIIYLISSVLDSFLTIPLIASAFRGIKVGVGVLIFNVAVKMLKKMPKKPFPRIIAGSAFAAMLVINFCALNISSMLVMIAAGTVSLSLFILRGAPEQKGGDRK